MYALILWMFVHIYVMCIDISWDRIHPVNVNIFYRFSSHHATRPRHVDMIKLRGPRRDEEKIPHDNANL
jgi:hypothetical protein